MFPLPVDKGDYLLVAELINPVEIKIGAMGNHTFNPGIYCYSGSARGPGGLKARITHHLRNSHHPTWHFDYLRPFLVMLEVWYLVSEDCLECEFIHYLKDFYKAEVMVEKFGSSDCRNQCGSHLVYLPSETKIAPIFKGLNEHFPYLHRIFLSKSVKMQD